MGTRRGGEEGGIGREKEIARAYREAGNTGPYRSKSQPSKSNVQQTLED